MWFTSNKAEKFKALNYFERIPDMKIIKTFQKKIKIRKFPGMNFYQTFLKLNKN